MTDTTEADNDQAEPPQPPQRRPWHAPSLVRLGNREDLGAALGLTPAETRAAPDPVLLRRAIERWGDAGVARCLGAFAFALWESEAGRLTLGRDCLGRAPLFFHRAREWVV